MDEKIITTNELEVLANEFYGSKITQEEYFSRLDDIDCYQAHYLKARVYLDKQDLSNAMIEINTSIHMIEAIYFGYRCVESNVKNIMQILGEGVQYFKMDYDPNNVYKLKVNKILYKDYIDT